MTRAKPAIDLWYLAPEDPDNAALMAACESVLAPEELERADRFRFPRDRASYVAAHGVLRLALSKRATDVSPRDWMFHSGRHGKPEIAGKEVERGIRFSLSHTRGFAACAITASGMNVKDDPSSPIALGVDVEAHQREVGLEVADRYFHASEREALVALPEAERRGRFMELWTLKEAFVKAIGLGLTCPVDQVIVRELGERPRLDLPAFLDEPPSAWQFGSWLVEGHRVAVALRREGADIPVQIRRWGGRP